MVELLAFTLYSVTHKDLLMGVAIILLEVAWKASSPPPIWRYFLVTLLLLLLDSSVFYRRDTLGPLLPENYSEKLSELGRILIGSLHVTTDPHVKSLYEKTYFKVTQDESLLNIVLLAPVPRDAAVNRLLSDNAEELAKWHDTIGNDVTEVIMTFLSSASSQTPVRTYFPTQRPPTPVKRYGKSSSKSNVKSCSKKSCSYFGIHVLHLLWNRHLKISLRSLQVFARIPKKLQ